MHSRNYEIFFIKILNKLLHNKYTINDGEILNLCDGWTRVYYTNDLNMVVILISGKMFIIRKCGNEYVLLANKKNSHQSWFADTIVYDIDLLNGDLNNTILVSYKESDVLKVDTIVFENILDVENDEYKTISTTINKKYDDIASIMFIDKGGYIYRIMCYKKKNNFILEYKYNVLHGVYQLVKTIVIPKNTIRIDRCDILIY